MVMGAGSQAIALCVDGGQSPALCEGSVRGFTLFRAGCGGVGSSTYYRLGVVLEDDGWIHTACGDVPIHNGVGNVVLVFP